MRLLTRWLTLGFATLSLGLLTAVAAAGSLPTPTEKAPGVGRTSAVRPKILPLKPVLSPLSGSDQTLQGPPANDQCAGAITIACGNISLSGNTFTAINNYDFQDTTLSCTEYSAGGRDVVYKLNATAGDSIWVRYQSSADASIYIVTDCAHVQDSCKAGADVNHQGQLEELRYGFPRTGTYYLILDSYGLDTYGTWTLAGQFFSCGLHPPSNDRCETATPITCGSFLYSGDTFTAQNDYSFPSLPASCATGTLAGGRDVAFSLGVTAGDSISVSLSSTTDAVLYLIYGCPASGTGVTCAIGANATGVGGTETINYSFVYSGSYTLVVDSHDLNTDGGWSLSGTLTCGLQYPTNDVCGSATFLPCGPFNLSGDNSLAFPDYDPTDSACTGFAALGADLAYRIQASGGDSIWCDYYFPHVNGHDDVDASIYIVTDCSNPADSCVVGVDNVGAAQIEGLRYKFPRTGTYYLILDSYDSGIAGIWTATGEIICPHILGVGGSPGRGGVQLAATPNPFDRSSTLRFTLGERSRAVMRVYDIAGRVVRTVLDAELAAGEQSASWDALDDRGVRVAGGTYFARLTVGGQVAHRTLILVR